jgi:hypothetical protein
VSASDTTATNGNEIRPSELTSVMPAARNRTARAIWVGNPEHSAISPIAVNGRAGGWGVPFGGGPESTTESAISKVPGIVGRLERLGWLVTLDRVKTTG